MSTSILTELLEKGVLTNARDGYETIGGALWATYPDDSWDAVDRKEASLAKEVREKYQLKFTCIGRVQCSTFLRLIKKGVAV